MLVPLVTAWAIAAAPAHAGSTEISLPMDDGVSLAATLYLPDGTAPAGGWPAVMLFHGLGGTRASMAPIAQGFLVNQGYAVLAYDARGHGASGGLVTLDGPREMADLREAFSWLTSRSEVSDTQVGAMGFSLGGGAVLRAAVEGVPFKAIVPTMTWTDLYEALAPQGWPKTGAIANFLQSVHSWDPAVYGLAQQAIQSQNTAAVKAFTAQRSSLAGLKSLSTPTFFIQGRRDYAFDISQARKGYNAVKGPKRLYLGDLGHAPAANPPAESPHYLTEAREWFDRYVKGLPNGIDTRRPIEVAADPWTGKTASFKTFPKTKVLTLQLKGAKRTIAATRQASCETVKLPKRALEAFGSATLTVSVSSNSGWPHLVAVLSALTPGGGETVISEGGVPTSGLTGQSTRVTIRLLDDATLIPSGSRLRLTLASSSTAQNIEQRPLPRRWHVPVGQADRGEGDVASTSPAETRVATKGIQMRKTLRLGLLAVAAATSLAFASSAFGAYAPKLSITRSDEVTSITFSQTDADDATAKVTILAPAGFSGGFVQPAGTNIGTLDGSVVAGAFGGATVPVAGTIVAGDPTNAQLMAAAKVCTGSETHAAIWLLNVTAAGTVAAGPRSALSRPDLDPAVRRVRVGVDPAVSTRSAGRLLPDQAAGGFAARREHAEHLRRRRAPGTIAGRRSTRRTRPTTRRTPQGPWRRQAHRLLSGRSRVHGQAPHQDPTGQAQALHRYLLHVLRPAERRAHGRRPWRRRRDRRHHRRGGHEGRRGHDERRRLLHEDAEAVEDDVLPRGLQ